MMMMMLEDRLIRLLEWIGENEEFSVNIKMQSSIC
jgi:hypothetical protein